MHNGKEKMEQSFVCTFSDGVVLEYNHRHEMLNKLYL